MRTIARLMSVGLLMTLSLGSTTAQTPATQTPEPQTPEQAEPSPPEIQALTLAQVTQMLHSGMTSQAVIKQVELSRSVFDLTVEDVVRLKRLGASPELIQVMTRPAQSVVPALETPPPSPEPAQMAAPAAAGTLTYKKILRMYRKGVPPDQIANEIARNGLKETIELGQLLDLGSEGWPETLLMAMAAGARPATSTSAKPAAANAGEVEGSEDNEDDREPPLKTAEILGMLERKQPQAEVISAIETRGIVAPPSLQEAITLRKLGATDQLVATINNAALDLEEDSSAEETEPDQPLVGPSPAFPPTADTETVTVLSYPEGARVYLSPARTRMDERFRHDYLVGKTPVSVTVPPGDYSLIVEKRAGTFESGLLPAWRTMHDPPGIRSVLDDTDLTFNPAKCCLPGSISGIVNLRPVPEDQQRAVIGDQFDGLPPFLFDGETLQILRVRHSQITDVMKVYPLRKVTGQARALIAAFIPAEGDPLDLDADAAAGPAPSFDAELQLPQLQFLNNDAGQKGMAAALGVETEHMAKAIAVLKRVGKVILHQQVPRGVRLITMSIDYNGRLRVTDQTILPETPFAAAPVKKGKKKNVQPPPPPIPPLPTLERVVVPGLGSPRLNAVNPGPAPVALIFDDGEFCYAPGGATTECVIDPGTHQVSMVSGGEKRGGGTIHLSYHARSTMKMPPMPVR